MLHTELRVYRSGGAWWVFAGSPLTHPVTPPYGTEAEAHLALGLIQDTTSHVIVAG